MSSSKKKSERHSKGISRSYYFVFSFFFVVFVVLVHIAYQTFREPIDDNSTTNVSSTTTLDRASRKRAPEIVFDCFQPNISRSVPIRSWKIGKRFLREVIKSQKPTVIRNSPYQNWELSQMNMLDLAKNQTKSVILKNSRWQQESLFILGHEREKGGMLGSAHDRAVAYTDIELLEFLKSTFDNSTYLYWTGELLDWHNMTAVGDLDLWRQLKVLEKGLEGVVDEDDVNIWKPMLWMSHPGVVSQTHYDTQHNFFVQLQGTKTFTLFQPDAELHYYPNIHRSYRQSQIQLERDLAANCKSNESDCPISCVRPLGGLQVTVVPGDVLYIPPFWAHRVESVTLSLSLSVLSPSSIETAMAEAFWEKVPFGSLSSTANARSLVAAAYLRAVLETFARVDLHAQGGLALDPEVKPLNPAHRSDSDLDSFVKDFSTQLFRTRFGLLFPIQELKKMKASRTRYERSLLEKSVDSDVEWNVCGVESMELSAALFEQSANFRQAADNIVQSVEAFPIDDSGSRHAIQLTFLRDYVEQVSRWAVGPVLTPLFIYECLSSLPV